jgi:hypothetical protein
MRCHAGAAHAPATDHGAYGGLCAACFAAVMRLLRR